MGLDTETDRGANKFSYFSKKGDGRYECNSKAVGKLGVKQLDYLNMLYTQYNSVRHCYSHWSVSDVDTPVITDCAEAREKLMDGLEMIDKYYMLF